MNAEAASAARDLIAVARAAAETLDRLTVRSLMAADLRDSVNRLAALVPPLPLRDQLAASLAMESA